MDGHSVWICPRQAVLINIFYCCLDFCSQNSYVTNLTGEMNCNSQFLLCLLFRGSL